MPQKQEKFQTYKMNGKYLSRIKIESNFCPECNNSRKEYHRIGCKLEYSPCDHHMYYIECDCDLDKDNPV